MHELFPVIFKRDSTGKIRTWQMELKDNSYRTISGVHGGKAITTEWTVAYGKNIGKSNETSDEEQALNEIESQYQKKLSVDYYNSIEESEIPKVFKPMLATEYQKRLDKISWENVLMNPKLDGARCIAVNDGLFTRTGKMYTTAPHIIAELQQLFMHMPSAILDGELYNHAYKDDFEKLMSLVKKTKPTAANLEESAKHVEYHVYDIVSEEEYSDRHELLRSMFDMFDFKAIKLVSVDAVANESECDRKHEEYLDQGYEGSMIRLPAPYAENKRSNSLIKRKDFTDAEFTILGFEEGKGNYANLPKVLLFEMADGTVGKATMKGSMKYLKVVKEEAEEYIGKTATITFFGFTKDNNLRFPVVKHLYKVERNI